MGYPVPGWMLPFTLPTHTGARQGGTKSSHVRLGLYECINIFHLAELYQKESPNLLRLGLLYA